MKFETKIVTLLMCVALSLLSSCNKKLPDTPVQEQQVPVGFRAMSQAVWVKSGETDPDKPKFSDIHDDFGVWGIARQEGIQSPYILWSSNGLTKVEELTTDPGVYAPVTAAYWIKDYKYNFLAIAPYTDLGTTPIFTAGNPDATPATSDIMTFTYDMSSKYAGIPANGSTPAVAPDYDFDLLGAAAETQKIQSGHTASQSLIFWHLFTKIAINVTFSGLGNDADGNPIIGSVTEMRLNGVDSEGTYTIAYDDTKTNDLAVSCISNSNKETTVTFSGATGTVHVLPQNITDFEMYIDFTIGDVTYTEFKLNLDIQTAANPNGTNPSEYKYNENYAWNITIGPKEDISFKVEVTPWVEEQVNDNDIEIL